MSEIYCKVTPYGLVPLYESDLAIKKKLKVGTVVKCNVTIPRNYKFHKKFFALVRLTYDNLPVPYIRKWNIRSVEDMLKRFKRDLGYCTYHTYEDGSREVEYKSISFAAMDEVDFEKFYEDCVNLILFSYIPGIEKGDIENELINYQ